MFHGWLILLGVVALQAAIILAIRKYKLDQRSSFAAYAIFVMWKTQRGKRVIEWLSRRKLKGGEVQPVEGPAAWGMAEKAGLLPEKISFPGRPLPKIVGNEASEVLWTDSKRPAPSPTPDQTTQMVDIDGSSAKETLAGPEAMGPLEPASPDPNLGSAPRRAWHRIGDLAIVFFIVFMAFMVGLLLWEATLVSQIPDESAPTAEMALGIPGINPIIPVGYGILGLAISIIVHEFAHGVLARAEGMRVKSLGLLFFVLPMGAFVEPDEEEMKKAPRRKRMRIYAAGPASNFLCALFCLLIFVFVFMAPVEPRAQGTVVLNAGVDSPADRAGLEVWELVTEIGGIRISDTAILSGGMTILPGTQVEVKGLYRSEPTSHPNAVAGLTMISVSKEAPAGKAGLQRGMVFTSVRSTTSDTPIFDQRSLSTKLGLLDPGDPVTVNVLVWNESSGAYSPKSFGNISLTDKGSFYRTYHPSIYRPEFDGVAFLGVTTAYMGIVGTNPENLLAPMKSPYDGIDDPGDFVIANFRLITFPLVGLSPAEPPFTDLFVVKGPLGGLPSSVFWTVANSFYWVFWLNVMVGLTNVLPLKIVDGGHFFRDAFSYVVGLKVKDRLRAEMHAGRVEWGFTFLILFLIVWQFVGPRVV